MTELPPTTSPTEARTLPIAPGLAPLPRAPRRLSAGQGIAATFVAAVGLIVLNVIAGLAVLVGGAPNVGSILRRIEDPDVLFSFPMLLAGQIANLLAFVTVATVAPPLFRVRHGDALGLRRPPLAALGLGMIAILMLNPLADTIVRLVKAGRDIDGNLELIERSAAGQPLWVLVPVLALMPAIGEELICRGILLRSIRRPVLAIGVSALVFAALHMDPVHMAGVLPLGILLSWLGWRSGSLFVPIAAHFANNGVAAVALGIAADHPELIESAETPPVWAAPLGVCACLALCVVIHRWTPPNHLEGPAAEAGL